MEKSKAIPRAIAIVVVLVGLTACIWWLTYAAPVKASKDIAAAIKETLNFNGQIMLRDETVYEADRDITELAIREKTYTYTYQWEHKWAGSTKELKIQGRFRGKSGYDFTEKLANPKNPWGIEVAEDGAVTARMPEPTILSVEMLNYQILEDSNGFWNKVSKEDREQAVNRLQHGAKKRFSESGVLEEVDSTFAQQIEDALSGFEESKVDISREPFQ